VQFVEMIIGRRLAAMAEFEHHDLSDKRVGASVADLGGGTVRDVSLDLHEGEVVGLTGLIGSGFDEVPYLIYGAKTARSGRLAVGDERYDLTALAPPEAVAAGLALIPADRPNDGCVASLPVAEHLALAVLDRYFNGIALDRRRTRRETAALMRAFDVRPNENETFIPLRGVALAHGRIGDDEEPATLSDAPAKHQSDALPLHERKEQMRQTHKGLVIQVAQRSGVEHRRINLELVRRTGSRIENASLDQLKRRIKQLEKWVEHGYSERR